MTYDFNHQGKAFNPDGTTPVVESQGSTDARNQETERKELDWLRTGPDKVFLYVTHPRGLDGFSTRVASITTWLGTVVSSGTVLGPKAYVGFGFNSYRRSVTCSIFGIKYVGWYYESSGQYCRLRKAKV